MRQVERQVMLHIIDQQWREHLYEMDYLQEGIHLRAMGQKDPLVEWQREGFDMFGQMMHGIAQDFVKYVMHVQVTVAAAADRAPQVSNVRYSAPDDPSTARSTLRRGRRRAGASRARSGPRAGSPRKSVVNVPVVKSEWDKTPRNALPVRQRQEVQDVPQQHLRIDELRQRRPQLETEASIAPISGTTRSRERVTRELGHSRTAI